MRIFHIATLADWKQAQDDGTYTTSTYGRTLDQEGFIHASRHDQVPEVRDRCYGDVAEPLVVLEVETDLLEAEVREEQVGDEVFPHVYGPIPTSAVVAWRPARPPAFDRPPDPEPASPLTRGFRGVGVVLGAATLVMFVAAILAQSRSEEGRLSDDLAFLLWTLTLAALAAAMAAFAVSVLVDRRS
jgi:glutathione S-transferase